MLTARTARAGNVESWDCTRQPPETFCCSPFRGSCAPTRGECLLARGSTVFLIQNFTIRVRYYAGDIADLKTSFQIAFLSKNQNFNPNYGNYSRLDVTTTPCWYGGHLAIPADWRRRWPEVSCERTREAERSRSASLFSAHFAYNICKGEGFLFSFFLLPFLSSKIVDIIAAHSVALVKQSGVSLDVLSEWMAPGVSMYIYTTIWAYYPF